MTERTTPKFKVGNIIRYGSGETALMRVEMVREHHGGYGQHRYYGEQFYGGKVGAYEENCVLACEIDLINWDNKASYV